MRRAPGREVMTSPAQASSSQRGGSSGVPRGAPAAAVAQELVKAMSSPSLVDHAQLPSWDSCADQLAQVYLSSLGISPEDRTLRTRDLRRCF